MIFLLVLTTWAVASVWLWRSADRRARAVGGALGLVSRIFFVAFLIVVLGYAALPISRLFAETEPTGVPAIWSVVAYLWYPCVINLTLLAVGGRLAARAVRRLVRKKKRSPLPDASPSDEKPVPEGVSADRQVSRRAMFRLAVAAAPPVLTCGLTGAAMAQRGEFRVRRLTLTVPSLPEDLDGLTIAHLSDLHAGQFMPAEAVARIADATNALAADLVVFTGDLIDRGLLDRVPLGLGLIDGLSRRDNLALIEGNHDLFESSADFERAIRDRNLPFLLDGQVTYDVPSKRHLGRTTPVQLLGISWGEETPDTSLTGKPRVLRGHSPDATAAAVAKVAALRRPDAFPILLAHHPNAFDDAVRHGLPITLSGHTHGGQVMLTDNIGAGPLRFRYWNGVHQRDGCQLVISNGLGSWFPLRVNAPAEILHLTLRRGS